MKILIKNLYKDYCYFLSMNILYSFLRIPYGLFKKSIRKINFLINRTFFNISRKELINKLKEIGLKKESIVYVHSSMNSFGYIKGGADSVIDCILKLIGDKGTIIMPAFTHPKKNFSINDSCWTGKLSETLRLRKNVFRSIHPTHSIVAFGPLAKYITTGHEKSKAPFDEKSPFHKIANKKSFILMLGTENNSMIHYIQNKVNFPNLFLKENKEFKFNKKLIKTKVHHSIGSIKYVYNNKPCSDVQFLVKMYKDKKFEEKGYMKTIKIGKATCHLINTQDFVRVVTKYLKDNLKKYKGEYAHLIKDE